MLSRQFSEIFKIYKIDIEYEIKNWFRSDRINFSMFWSDVYFDE